MNRERRDIHERPVLQVSDITGAIKELLEEGFPDLTVEGEISNYRPASSGHVYFALKDTRAVIQCVLFRSDAARLDFAPRDGNLVRVYASVSVYPPRGTYQLIVREMRVAGEGRILAMLQERKTRLRAAGLFDRARPLPWFPRTAAVITSPTGAAIRDILQVLQRRRAGVQVRVLPVPVQGDSAGPVIAAMVRYADHHHLGEVIVVTRGGGALEDLLPFSDEAVVRAIYDASVPVISAVGHETDVALSDFAADYRAPTPSAAAEVLCAGEEEVRHRIRHAGEAVVRAYVNTLDRLKARVQHVSTEELRYRYRNFVQPSYQRVDTAHEEIRRIMRERIVNARNRIAIARERVEGSSPYSPLQRGYAIVRDRDDGTILVRADTVHPGRHLDLQFADGTVPVYREGARDA